MTPVNEVNCANIAKMTERVMAMLAVESPVYPRGTLLRYTGKQKTYAGKIVVCEQVFPDAHQISIRYEYEDGQTNHIRIPLSDVERVNKPRQPKLTGF